MDAHRAAEAEERLAALRRAVYARDAAPEAAAAYAAALAGLTAGGSPAAEAVVADPPRSMPSQRHHRWAALGAACGILATLALGSVIAARHAPAPAAATPSRTSSPASSPSVIAVADPPPRIVPPPVPGPVLATFTSTSGAFGAHLDALGRHVFLAAECVGTGTVTIRLSDGSVTVLTCGDGLPTLVMSETAKPLRRFTVTTDTTERPVWALTVGVLLTAAP